MDPFDEMRRMQEDMNRILKRTAMMADNGKIREPILDMMNKNKEITIIAELPGMEKEGIDIEIKPTLLTIEAGRKRNREKEREGYYLKERSSSKFKRTLSLPEEVIPEKSEAEFRNGILEILMPKKHFIRKAHKGKKIKVR